MPLLIDGYNLMHAAGIVGPGRGPGGLERSRGALIRFVAAALTDAERRRAIIVFDAAGAPPGLPQSMVVEGLLVRFARGYADADALLEELIAADHSPRQLTVVSSDHRVQRAATRRRATAVDSEKWFEQVRRRRYERSQAGDDKPGATTPEFETPRPKRSRGKSEKPTTMPGPKPRPKSEAPGDAKPGATCDDAEVQFWLRRIVGDRETADDRWSDVFPPGYGETWDENSS